MRDSNASRNPFPELYCFLIFPFLICTFNCFLVISCFTAIIIIFVVVVAYYVFLAYNKVVNRNSFLASCGYHSISCSWLSKLPRVFDSRELKQRRRRRQRQRHKTIGLMSKNNLYARAFFYFGTFLRCPLQNNNVK